MTDNVMVMKIPMLPVILIVLQLAILEFALRLQVCLGLTAVEFNFFPLALGVSIFPVLFNL